MLAFVYNCVAFVFVFIAYSRETDEQMLQVLMDLVYQLLSDGELYLARTMRKKVLEKFEKYRLKQAASHTVTLLSSYQLTAK